MTLYPTTSEVATSNDLSVVTESDGLESTHTSQPRSLPLVSPPSITTGSDGEISTEVVPTQIGSGIFEVTSNPNSLTSLDLSASGTGSNHITNTPFTSSGNQESPHLSTDHLVTASDTPNTALPPASTNDLIKTSDVTSEVRSGDIVPSTVTAGQETTSMEHAGESTSSDTAVPKPSGISTIKTERTGETTAFNTNTLATILSTSDIESGASIATSYESDAPHLPLTQTSASSLGETKGSESDIGSPTHRASTSTYSEPLSTSVPESDVNGVTGIPSTKLTTQEEAHSTDVDSTGAAQITTTGDSSSSTTYLAVPVTTSVSKPEPRDDGFVLPCNMWFFDACIGPISGWGISLPPGTYPPGPPPALSDNPKGGIQINTNRPLPDWPGFIVGPGNTPTFSDEPTACETDSAELCVTSTSYGVSVDATATSTVTSDVSSTCGIVYGCKVQDHSQTVTATEVTTASEEAPAPSLHAMETWPDMQETEAELQSIAKRVESELDSLFGTATRMATTTTEDASLPTQSVWEGTCPAKNGPYPTVIDGKFPENMGEKCLCEWNTWMKTDKTLEPYTVDQLEKAIGGFCDGSRVLRKPVSNASPDYAVHTFPTDGTHGILIQAGWATPPLWNVTDERCKAKSDLVLAESCKTALWRFECRGAKKEDLWGGTYYEVFDEGGCVRWLLTPAHLPDAKASE
ncbi:oviduct-specific glyco [Fusarium beomiforme]|uniref:Oviduct-specific glyco n=1 Tax=Fusarium beomiforme TaxID=44412 RepID=A0A9P5DQZ0_9HYPO|nr:oviduct-specific glyco [Fusarium beomiforme]